MKLITLNSSVIQIALDKVNIKNQKKPDASNTKKFSVSCPCLCIFLKSSQTTGREIIANIKEYSVMSIIYYLCL